MNEEGKVIAPWSHDQIVNLCKRQANGSLHGYTCIESEHGNLSPTTIGWLCRKCGYTQNWAHEADTMDQPDPLQSTTPMDDTDPDA